VINGNLGLIATRSLNIYELVREINNGNLGLIATRLLNIYNAVDGVEGSLSSVASRLLWSGDLGGGTKSYTAGELLGNLNLLSQQQRTSLSSIAGRLLYNGDIGYGTLTYSMSELVAQLARTTRSVNYRSGVLSGVSSSSLTYSTADLLFHLNNLLYRRTYYEGDIGYGSTSYTISELLASLARTTRSVNYRSGVLSWVSDGERTYSTADLLFYSNNLLNSRTLYNGDIGYGSGSYTMSELLAQIARNTRNISVGGAGDAFDKLLSGVNAIGSLLNPGAVVDGVTDVLGDLVEVPELADSLIGDLDFDSMDELASNIGAVVSGKFPFSIPFVFLGMLTIFEAPPAPPVFEFDIAGSPMVLDFSEYEGFAELSRFFCSFFFAVSLLAVSRRFIFFGGGSNAD